MKSLKSQEYQFLDHMCGLGGTVLQQIFVALGNLDDKKGAQDDNEV